MLGSRHLNSFIKSSLFAVLMSASLAAQNSAVHISQLRHSVWRLQEGSLPGMPNSIAQTKDGYIWMAAENGLYRFDGQQFLEVLNNQHSISTIRAMLAAKDGSLWLASGQHLLRWNGSEMHEIPHGKERFDQFIQTSHGEIYAATTKIANISVCRLLPTAVDCFQQTGLEYGITLTDGGGGNLWATDGKHLEHRVQGSVIRLSDSDDRRTQDITILGGNGRGIVWAGVKREGKQPILQIHDNGTWSDGPTLPGTNPSTAIQNIVFDREGAVWVGTSNAGLYRINGPQVDRYSRTDGLTADDVRDIYPDAEGSIWVTTSAGLDQFHRGLVDTWTTKEGLTADSVSSILVDHIGRVWMGNDGGLDVLQNGLVHSYRSDNGLPGQTVDGLAEDHRGHIWVGVDGALYIFDGTSFKKVPGPDGKPFGYPVVLKEDSMGRMWVRTNKGLFRFSGDRVEEIEGTAPLTVRAMEPDNEGGMWIGGRGYRAIHVSANVTRVKLEEYKDADKGILNALFSFAGYQFSQTQHDLSIVKDGNTHLLNQANGLQYKTLIGAQLAGNDGLYLMTNSSYLRISESDLLKWLHDPHAVLSPQVISSPNGALPGTSVFTPVASLAPNGDIWFATDRFPQRIDPKVLAQHPPPPHSS